MGTMNYDVTELANDTLVTTAETVVATLSGVTTGRKKDVNLSGSLQLTSGTNTTAVTLRIRRGIDATGLLIGEANPVTLASAAGGTDQYWIEAVDSGVDLSGATYVLTAQQAGATANGTGLAASLHAEMSE